MTEAPKTDSPLSSTPGVARCVVVLEPDDALSVAITRALEEVAPGTLVQVARTLQDAQALVTNQRPDLFVLDIDAAYEAGQEFLYDLRTSHPEARAIILTEFHLPKHREQAAGLGAIHFLEKPFPHGDFIDLAQALLTASEKPDERFQGKLSDLHLADIIQLKCMSGATSALEFTGPKGEKAQVYFDHGQVRHATTPGSQGVTAFNQIVGWKGGVISELAREGEIPRTIDIDWQVLLMEAVRLLDESHSQPAVTPQAEGRAETRNVLVIDDSLMLLSFVKEMLSEAEYTVRAAATAQEGFDSIRENKPDLILLDHALPDMNGDEVCRRLAESPETAATPIVYMSGFGADLNANTAKNPNVIGTLHKPFTSDLLLETLEKYLPRTASPATAPEAIPPSPPANEALGHAEVLPATIPAPVPAPPVVAEIVTPVFAAQPPPEKDEAPSANLQSVAIPAEPPGTAPELPPVAASPSISVVHPIFIPDRAPPTLDVPSAPREQVEGPRGTAYFSGHTGIISLNRALQAIAREKLTGIFRGFWRKDPIELFARDGKVILVTTRNPELYCPEAPITLLNVDAERNTAARQRQSENGCPLFLTLASEGLVLKEPALDLVQHYGQKLFALLWTAGRVSFAFEQKSQLEEWVADLAAPEEDVDHWILNTLRFTQYQELDENDFDPGTIPAYTRSGYERIQSLRLTVAEAQFASQFNGNRSTQQIAKNLRLDLKFARLTLFRFIALEIVECWPATALPARETGSTFRRFLGLGD